MDLQATVKQCEQLIKKYIKTTDYHSSAQGGYSRRRNIRIDGLIDASETAEQSQVRWRNYLMINWSLLL